MKDVDLYGLGEFNGIAGAVDIGDALRFGIGGQIVNGGEMEQVFDLALEFGDIGRGDAELRLGDIDDDGHDAVLFVVQPPPGIDRLEFFQRCLAHQYIDDAFSLQQVPDHKFADQADSATSETIHL